MRLLFIDKNTTFKPLFPQEHLNVTSHLNYDLEDGEWISGIIWDDEKDNGPPVKLTLNLNDTNMLFDVAEVEATKPRVSEPKYSRKNKRPAIKQAVVKVSFTAYQYCHFRCYVDKPHPTLNSPLLLQLQILKPLMVNQLGKSQQVDSTWPMIDTMIQITLESLSEYDKRLVSWWCSIHSQPSNFNHPL